jgi:hypothetical protein
MFSLQTKESLSSILKHLFDVWDWEGNPKGTFASTKAAISVKARGPKRRRKLWRPVCRGRVCTSYSQARRRRAAERERETHSLPLHTPSPKYKNPSPQPWISPAEPPLGPTPTTSTPCPTLLRTVTGNMDLVLRLHLSGWKSCCCCSHRKGIL